MDNLSKTQLQGKKILFATCPADGHFNPLTGLAKYLQVLGCEVRWYTSSTYRKKLDRLNIPLYSFQHALDINGENLEEVFPERKQITDPIEKINFDMINAFWSRSVEYFADLKDIHKEFAFDLMVCDNMFSAIPFVKIKMGIPVATIGVIPLGQGSVDLAPYGMALMPPTNEDEETQYAQLRELAKNVWFKSAISTYNSLLNLHGIESAGAPGDMLINLSDVYLQIGTPSFEYKRSDLTDNIQFVGPLMPYTTGIVKEKWFDQRINEYKKVILVTQGTVEKNTVKLLEPAIEAFKNSDVLVIVTTGGVNTAMLREKYPYHNVIIEDNIPFDDVMPYANVFVTNGGYGGTLFSIKHWLPIVAAGVHEGKNEVCARIGYFNYGINLNTETPASGQIKEAVNKVLSDGSYKKNISMLAREMEGYQSEVLCAEHLASVLTAIVPAD